MMTNKQPAPPTPREERRIVVLGRELLAVLRHNWGFKLLALLLAVVLWAGLITQNPDLTREKIISGADITVNGMDSIKRSGFIVTSDLEGLPDVQLRVDVPQGQYENAAASNYNVRIDLSRITEAGMQQAKILTSNTTAYGTVLEVSPASVEIEVEEYVTRYRIPVMLETVGESPAGFYVGPSAIDPPLVAVSGPKSLVNAIARAEAVLDLSTLPARAGRVDTAVPITLVTGQGLPVESNLIQVTSESVLLDSIVVEQVIYAEKTLNLSDVGLVVGTPADGYEIKSVTIAPERVIAAGSDQALAELNDIFADGTVDVTGLTDSVSRSLRMRRPAELNHLSQDTVTVAVEIGPVIRSRTYENLKVNLVGLESGLNAQLGVRKANATVEGPQLWVNKLRSSSITLSVDASGLTAGVYSLPVLCEIADEGTDNYYVSASPMMIDVTITAR